MICIGAAMAISELLASVVPGIDDAQVPAALNLVTKDPQPARMLAWWVLPLAFGGAGLVLGGLWWWWRQRDALQRDPGAWAARKLLATQPRAARARLRAIAKQRGVPMLALLMSPSAAGLDEAAMSMMPSQGVARNE